MKMFWEISLVISISMFFIQACSTKNNSNNSNTVNTVAANNSIASNSVAANNTAIVVNSANSANSANDQDDEIPQPDANFAGIEPLTNKSFSINQDTLLRIEEKVGVFWKGVTGCGDQSRIDQEVTSEFNRWVAQKKSQHQDLTFLRAGAPASKVTWRSSDGRPIGERSCSASTTLACYIEFVKPDPFTLSYEAIKQTEWISHPAERNAKTGIIRKGEAVYFEQIPPSGGVMQAAKLESGTIVFVETQNFKRR